MPGHATGGLPPSLLLNAYYHRNHEYIWLRVGHRKGLRDIKPFMKRREWGMAGHTTGDIQVSAIECVLS